jgi:hypothetical protein
VTAERIDTVIGIIGCDGLRRQRSQDDRRGTRPPPLRPPTPQSIVLAMTKKPKSSPRRHLTCIFVLLLLCGCEAREPAKQGSKAEQLEAREKQFLADPANTRPELIRRLRAAVSMRDGLIIVKSQFGQGMAILPASAPWAVICGVEKISVHFGGAVARCDPGSGACDDARPTARRWLWHHDATFRSH